MFQPSVAENHGALVVREGYHAYLRTVFSKVLAENPDVHKKQALFLRVKAIHNNGGPNGPFPT